MVDFTVRENILNCRFNIIQLGSIYVLKINMIDKKHSNEKILMKFNIGNIQ